MTTEQNFDRFLEEDVNLNKSRIDRIKEAQRVLSEFISNNSVLKAIYNNTIPQGSYRHKTIIKPVGEEANYDVDLLLIFQENKAWEPKDYLIKLADEFRQSGRYSDLTETRGKTRCVTIDYEGDFHVDLVPAIEKDSSFFICNKSTNEFEKSDGDGFASWFDERDSNCHGHLIPSVRLLKYLRDYQGKFDTKSIILTTIVGMCSEGLGSELALPIAFAKILTNVDTYLSQFTEPPTISNPSMPDENFDRHWKNDKDGFKRLKSAINNYAQLASEAIKLQNDQSQIKKWEEVFGNKFGKSLPNSNSNPPFYTSKPITPTAPWFK